MKYTVDTSKGPVRFHSAGEPIVARPAPTYEEGFEYGRKCARTMSPERRADNARMVRESEYFHPQSITRQYWRGFISAMKPSNP